MACHYGYLKIIVYSFRSLGIVITISRLNATYLMLCLYNVCTLSSYKLPLSLKCHDKSLTSVLTDENELGIP